MIPATKAPMPPRPRKQLGIEHEIVEMPRAEFSLEQLIDAYSEPFPVSSALAMLWVSSAVKKRATVLLTGDGGDDVYLGYPFFNYAVACERAARAIPQPLAPLVRGLANLLPDSGRSKRLRSAMSYATGGIGSWMQRHEGLPYLESRGILGEKLAGLRYDWREIPPSAASARRLFRDVFESHRELHFTSEFMPKVDGATMHYALEARAPFLDQKMWEFAATLSPEVRLQGGVLKAVLRKIAGKHLNRETAQRPKQGFVVPVERWLATRWSAMLDRLQGGTLLEREGWIAPGSLSAPIQEAKRKGEVPLQIWRLLVLESWMEKQPRPASSVTFRQTRIECSRNNSEFVITLNLSPRLICHHERSEGSVLRSSRHHARPISPAIMTTQSSDTRLPTRSALSSGKLKDELVIPLRDSQLDKSLRRRARD